MKKREVVRGRGSRVVSRSGALGSAGEPMFEHCEPRALLAAVFWDGGAGTNNWNDAANWNRGGVDALPVNGDDVTINVAANPTITFNSGTLTLNSLVTNEALTVAGGTLGVSGTADINAVLTMSGGTLSGGAWDVTGGTLRATSSGGLLSNMQITGDLTVDSTSASLRIGGTTRFTNARLTANGSSLQFLPGYTLMDTVIVEGAAAGGRSIQGAVGGVGTLTIAPSGVIRLAAGSGGNLTISNSSQTTLINNGLITAEADGRTLTISTTSLTNNATLQATAGALDVSATTWSNAGTVAATNATLTLAGAWSNTSQINATNSTLNLGGTFSTAGIGTHNRTGGAVNLTGTLDNSAGNLSLAAFGPVHLAGGTINGGTVTQAGANRLYFTSSGGTLMDATITGDLVLDVTSSRVRIGGTTRFGTARLAGNSSGIDFLPDYTLRDAIVVEGATAGGRSIQGGVGGAGTLTIAPTGSIRLAAGSGGNLSINNSSVTTLINNGTISADAAGRTLSISTTTITNNGTLEATAGTLDIRPTNFTNAGAVTVAGGTVSIAGDWSSTGTITLNSGTLELGGTFTTAGMGSINRSGGTVELSGRMDNTGSTFNFTAATGVWNFRNGTITGGTLNFNGGNRLAFTTSSGTLMDVTVNGDLILDGTSTRVRIGGSTRFTALRLAANSANAEFEPGYTLMDLVVAEGAAAGSRSIQGAVGGAGTFTIGSTGVIRLAAGSGGNLNISNSSLATLINNGLITAEATGRTLGISTSNFTNNATAQSVNGTLSISSTNWTNAATLTAAAGSTLDLSGAWINQGSVISTNGTVNLGGSFTTSGSGSITRTGGTINITGTMNNEGVTFQFNAKTGSWNMAGGAIVGGTVNISGPNRLLFTSAGGSLTDVQLNAEILLDTTSARARINGTTRFQVARLSANSASLDFGPGYTLLDEVVAEGAAAGSRTIQGAVGGTGTLTIGSTGIIRLAEGSGGNLNISNSSVMTLINNGLISAEAASRTLLFNNSGLTNNGTIRAIAGILNISTTNWSNAATGVISAASGTVTVSGAWSNLGNITIDNGTLNAGGTFSTAGFGSMTRSGGTVNLTGTMDNTGATFTFNAGTGSWNLAGGTVVNGAVVFSDSYRFVTTSSGGVFTDVQVTGDILLEATSARVRVGGSTRFTSVRMLGNSSNLEFAPGYTLMDTVVVEGATTGTRTIQGAVGGEGTLTIAPSGVIRLAAGSGGNLVISNSSLLALTNNGLISAEAAGRTLTINPDSFTNIGTVQVLAGTFNISPATFTNYAKNVLTGGTFNAFGTGMMTLPAKTVILTNNATIGVGAVGNFPAVMSLHTNNGTLQTGGGGTFTITPAGGTLVNNGTVRLAPTNLLNIAGNYTLADDAATTVEIQGETPSDIGRMHVTGTATLGGSATVVPVNGYEPSCVNLSFLTAGLRSGQFDSHSLPEAEGDHQVLMIYVGNDVRFAISPPSDFNHDGVLNSQDVFDFLNAFFNVSDLADFNDDGRVNSQDFFDFIADFFEGCD